MKTERVRLRTGFLESNRNIIATRYARPRELVERMLQPRPIGHIGQRRHVTPHGDLCKPNDNIALTHNQMHKIFVLVKQAIAALILEYTGDLPGAPSAADIVDIAVQNVAGGVKDNRR